LDFLRSFQIYFINGTVSKSGKYAVQYSAVNKVARVCNQLSNEMIEATNIGYACPISPRKKKILGEALELHFRRIQATSTEATTELD